MSSKNPFLEEEAALSDDSDVDSSEDEGEDDNDALVKEGAGFIADEDDSEEDEEEAPQRKKKKRHKRARERSMELDDEDINLVEENTGKTIKRHNKRVFKRQEETAAPVGRDGLAREFGAAGGDDYQGLEDFDDEHIIGRHEHWGRDGPEGSFDDEGGEMDDFIEHDGETNDAQFRAHRRALGKTARAQGISVEAAEEFLEIFGQDAETQQKLDVWYSANEIDHGMEGAHENDAGEVGGSAVDPVLVSKYHMRREDDEIRDANMPERLFVEMQNDVIPQFHADDAAAYVFNALFAPESQHIAKMIVEEGILEVEGVDGESVDVMMAKYLEMDPESLRNFENADGVVEGIGGFRLLRAARQDESKFPDVPPWIGVQAWRSNPAQQEHLRECIKTAIRFLFIDSFEVPVLAMFYKEYMGELLSLRRGDEPGLLPRHKAEELEKDDVKYLPGAVVAEGRHIRQWDVLWSVYDKAFQYFELTKQQQEKIHLLEKERAIGSIEDTHFDVYKGQFLEAATVEELNEWYQYFHMLLPKKEEEEPPEDGTMVQKRPKRASKYQTLVDSGVGSLAGKLVMGTDTFARSVDDGIVEVPDTDGLIPDPENEADIHLSARNDHGQAPSSEQVQRCLNSTQFLLIKEIQMHPLIRAKVREIVKRIATVSTEPTEAGEQVLTPFHKYGAVKRIKHKPVEATLYADAQFLSMMAAEKEGLLKVTVDVEEYVLDSELTRKFTNMYTLGIEADMHPSLYGFRTQIIDRVLHDSLVPMALEAVREEMLKKAQHFVAEMCCDSVWVEATTPPLQLKAIDDEDVTTGDNMEVVRGQRVCVVCWGDKDRSRLENSTCMVMLDARGYPCDVLTLPQFSGLIPASPPHLGSLHEDNRKAEDAAAIVTFLEKHWPHLIVVGTTSVACWQLQEDIKKICEDEITQNFTVRLVDDKLASIYESCSFAKSDLKDYPRLVRRATGLGRSCIEPLALLSALMMQKEDPELLAFQVHPLQGLVPNDKRARAYEQLLITAISQEGVCVNSCVQKDWLAPMLQFVPGLGPRKAQALLKAFALLSAFSFVRGNTKARMQAIKSLPENDDYMSGPVPSQTIVARDHLLATDHNDPDHPEEDEDDPWRVVRLLRHKVYANAAPYLRVTDPNEVHESNDEIFSMKDNMRVHPRDEDALSKIACAALDIADPVEAAEDPIPSAVQSPHKVMQVDIGMYDSDWQERHGGKESRISTFTDLAMELVKPYGAVRAPERFDLTEEQTFWALTGEDRNLLLRGKLVSAKVIWVKKDLAGLVTDNGVNCHLHRCDAKSDEPQSLEQVLQKGMEIQGRVLDLDFTNGGRLILVSKSKELAKVEEWETEYLKSADDFYHVVSSDERREVEKAKKEKLKLEQKTKFTPRPITHQRFANLSLFNVQRALKNPDWNNYDKLRRIIGVDPKGAKDGDFLFYPSTKGTAYLGLCIRLFRRDNTVPVFQKLDLMETKSHKSGNSLALGTPLKLQHFSFLREDETLFDDLDEVQVRFIRPYTALYQDVINHKHFAHGDKMLVNALLNEKWLGQPEYRLCLGFHPEGHVPEGQRPVGWGTIAIKLKKEADPTHYPFRICHMGYFCTFRKDKKSELYTSVTGLVNAMKKALQEIQKEQKQAEDSRQAQHAAQAQRQQPYGGYPQMPPPSGGYQGQYVHHMGYGGGQAAGFVGNARGY